MKRYVLYVDDELDNRLVFEAALSDEFHVLTAASAGEALEVLERIAVPVVVTDQRMPGASGTELLTALRRRLPHTKRVLLTAYIDPQAMLSAINDGQAYYFLQKPWDRATLVPVLIRAIEAHDLAVAVEQQALELAAQNEELLQVQARLKQANRAKSEFLANMSHEIRTPMTAILGFANVLRDRLVDPEELDLLATIHRNGEYLLEVINDILDVSRIEAGRVELNFSECSLRELTAEVVELMRLRSEAKGLQLSVDVDETVPRFIRSDALRLRQILINLIGNSIKFTDQGSVRVVVRGGKGAGGSQARVDVVDTGIGLGPDQIGRLFRPFTQADSSASRRFGGTGLGLTISRQLARMLGGDITVASELGRGSTFTLTVAVGSDRIEAAEKAARSPTTKPSPAVPHPRIHARILLAEDGLDNQRLLSFILKNAGAELRIVENGRQAVDSALAARDEGKPFDLIMMDMQMPVLDGYEATRELRQAGFTGPIIAVTAHAMNDERSRCLAAGCDDFAAKPIERNSLLELVRQWAPSEQPAGAPR